MQHAANPFGPPATDSRQSMPERATHAGLRAVAELPACLQPVFSGTFRWAVVAAVPRPCQLVNCLESLLIPSNKHQYYCRYFNSIQSECYDTLMHSDASVVCAAQTGAGKTVLMELGILRLLTRSISPSGQLQHPKGKYLLFLNHICVLVPSLLLSDPLFYSFSYSSFSNCLCKTN